MTENASKGDDVRVSIEGRIEAVFETGYLITVDGLLFPILKSQVTSIVERAEERRHRHIKVKESEKRA